MDTRERILAAMTWQEPDRVPLTIFENDFSRGAAERLLRNAGLGLIARPPVHRVERRQVEVVDREYWDGGQRRIRRTLGTPVGEVWQVVDPEAAYGSTWILEHYIKGPEDYRVMECVIRDELYHDNYASIREAQRRLGGDGLVYVRLAKPPIQEMLYYMMGVEQFAMDFHFHRDLFDSLHETMVQRYEELYLLAAESPVEIILWGCNLTSDMIGEERFRQYFLPVYHRLREQLSGTGKLISSHMDGRLASLKSLIGEADLDIIEALTPPPMGDLSVKEARKAWPNKALWINFTSCFHLEPPEVIEAHTRQLLEEAGSKRGFAIGVTENAPAEALERSLAVIARVLRE